MAMAQGAASQIGIVTETVFGTTPATPQLAALPFTAFNVNLTKDIYEDNSILADRMQRYSIDGNHHIQGDLDVNLDHTNYDGLFESLLNSSFSTNVLKVGNTRKSFTMEHAQTDIGQYTVYNGVLIDKVTINVPTNGLVTAKFTVMGKSQAALSTSTIDTSAGYTAATAGQPYFHVGGTFNEGGSSIGFLTAVSLTIDNGYTANFALGATSARDFSFSFVKVTGTASAYFENASLYNKFINSTSSSLDFTVGDGTNTMKFDCPNIKYTGASKQISGQGPVVIQMPFNALYHAASTSNVVITRSS